MEAMRLIGVQVLDLSEELDSIVTASFALLHLDETSSVARGQCRVIIKDAVCVVVEFVFVSLVPLCLCDSSSQGSDKCSSEHLSVCKL